jgi:hypothetical protein
MTKKAIPENIGEQFFRGKSPFFDDSEKENNNKPSVTPANVPLVVSSPNQQPVTPVQETITTPVTQPVVEKVNPPVNQSINSPIDTSQVLAKPKGFYISEKQDEDLDIAVKKLSDKMKGKLTAKIDRSTILRLIIDQANITNEEAISKLAGQLTSQLIRQLTG